MSDEKVSKRQFEIPELAQLKLENIVLKMSATTERAKRINEQYGALAQIRDAMIAEMRKEVGAPEDWLVNLDITAFVPPPPTPIDPDPKGNGHDRGNNGKSQ
jgi:hypothetical protein